MIHKFVANDNKGNVNILEVTSTGTKLGKVASPAEDTDVATKKYVDDNVGSGSLPAVTSADNGTKNTYATHIYSLTPAS